MWKHVLICGYCCFKLNSWLTSRQLLQFSKSKAAYKHNKQMVILLEFRPNLVICRMTLSNCATQNNVANSNIQVHHLIFIICILYTFFSTAVLLLCGTILKICWFIVCKTETLQNSSKLANWSEKFCGRLEKILYCINHALHKQNL